MADKAQIAVRTVVSAIALSVGAFIGISEKEGFSDKAYTPVKGDVPTIGFGTTKGVKLGDTITPQRAMRSLYSDVKGAESSVKNCVKVPLSQNEYDAYVSFVYNVGGQAFCTSTLVQKLNKGQYDAACAELLKWSYVKGRYVQGLANRRQEEYKTCMGTI